MPAKKKRGGVVEAWELNVDAKDEAKHVEDTVNTRRKGKPGDNEDAEVRRCKSDAAPEKEPHRCSVGSPAVELDELHGTTSCSNPLGCSGETTCHEAKLDKVDEVADTEDVSVQEDASGGCRSEERSVVAIEAFGHSSVRAAYSELGATGFYEVHGAEYRNPHSDELTAAMRISLDTWTTRGFLPPLHRALDLACGSGEASIALLAWVQEQPEVADLDVQAADPFTHEAYARRTGREASRWSFEDVADGVLDGMEVFDMVMCSFCLHLLDKSWLSLTLSALARVSRTLLVATPHKRPIIDARTGWEQLDEVVHSRVRIRLYKSSLI
mmetsp:Transcript_97717/g.280757  ORF Transcript_97717/g.280757 Transcript_97717/m.280757 type:complete len:326 (+) Transcript_97717:110-1087(+)